MCNDVSLAVSSNGAIMLAGNTCGGWRQHDLYVIKNILFLEEQP